MTKLNIGCGSDYKVGYINIDKNKKIVADIYLDIDGARLPFEDNSVEYIFCSHVIEHMFYPEKLLQEIERILTPNGTALIVLPAWNNPIHIGDLTHRNHANSRTFNHEKQLYNYNTNFVVQKITFSARWGTLTKYVPIKILEKIGWSIYDYWYYLKKGETKMTEAIIRESENE